MKGHTAPCLKHVTDSRDKCVTATPVSDAAQMPLMKTLLKFRVHTGNLCGKKKSQ